MEWPAHPLLEGGGGVSVVLEIEGQSITFNSTLHEYEALDTKLARASTI